MTEYFYGASQSLGDAIDSYDIATVTKWPDPTLGTASSSMRETTAVNALGQAVTMTDRNGTVHTLTYDVLGRVVSDAVTTLAGGVDGAVRRVETAYDGQGSAYLVTSYDAATGGGVVNQVQRAFNGLGQVTAEYQEHGGAVNTATSPKVQYAWSEMPSGANHSRLTSITYPDGYVLTYNYSSGLNDGVSRLSSLSDSTGTLESYSYLGVGTVVVRAHPQPNVDLSYVKRTGESSGDAGDQYTGLDRFGRVVDQRWLDPTSGTAADRFQYAYDLVSNRSYRDNLVNGAFGELYSYDDLSQLVSFQRGTLNGTKTGITGTAARSQGWDLDAAGNFDGVTTDGTAQSRTADRQNEITSIGGATTPAYDGNGNMTGDETGRQFVYDAWNRLVAVKNSSGTTLKTYGYDGLNRRVAETAGGTTTELYYSADWQVLSEKVGGNYAKRYVWSPVYVDAMVLRDRDTDGNGSLDERLWAQQDANWNVTALVNGSGVVVERYVYDPYGVRTVYDASYTPRSGGSAYDFAQGFQGMFFDSTAGLDLSRERPGYSPTLGRWVSVDPIQFVAGDDNYYRFVFNNPIRYDDAWGLAATDIPATPLFERWQQNLGLGDKIKGFPGFDNPGDLVKWLGKTAVGAVGVPEKVGQWVALELMKRKKIIFRFSATEDCDKLKDAKVIIIQGSDSSSVDLGKGTKLFGHDLGKFGYKLTYAMSKDSIRNKTKPPTAITDITLKLTVDAGPISESFSTTFGPFYLEFGVNGEVEYSNDAKSGVQSGFPKGWVNPE